MRKGSGSFGRAAGIAMAIMMVMTVLPAAAIGAGAPTPTAAGEGEGGGGVAEGGAGLNGEGYVDSSTVTPKFWVEPDGPYVPPPVTATYSSSRDGGRATNGYAVLMGINDYPSSPLQGCISDITAIRDRLVNSYGWSLANIHFVTDSAVTPDRITQELQWMASVADANSQTVFSFSGHGSPHTIYAYPMNGVSDETLATELKKVKSQENICILDSCFSGANTAVNISVPKFVSMMACGAGETAADGNTFSKAWVEGLGTTQWGETEDAFAYAYNKIQGWQHPVMWDNFPGKLMLARRPPSIMGTVPNQTAVEDTPITITLTDYESDLVDGHSQLNWTVDPWSLYALKSVTGQGSANDTLTFGPVKDYNGKTVVSLVLTNTAGRTARQNITLTWTPVNDPPVVTGFDKLWPSVERTKGVKVAVYGRDVDNSEDTLSIEVDFRPAGTQSWTRLSNETVYTLKHWEMDFVPPGSCPLGKSDIRARLKDVEGWSVWYANASFIEVLNSPPAVSGLAISVPDVHRMQNLTISVAGSDPETPREKMVCEIELKSSNDTYWSRQSPVSLVGESWRAVYRPLSAAPLGSYDLRARLRDSDTAYGDWKVMYAYFDVLNALPVLVSAQLSDSSVERGASVLFSMNGSDVEDSRAQLACDVQFKAPGGNWARLENVTLRGDHWEARFLPPSYFKTGVYSFRVVIRDTAGQLSDWLYLNSSLTVTNSLPRVSALNLSRGSLLRGQNLTFKVAGQDYEDPDSSLNCEVEYSAGDGEPWESDCLQELRYDARYSDWTGLFAPGMNLPAGSCEFRARLKDREGAWGPWFSPAQRVEVQNNQPLARIAPRPAVVDEGRESLFDASPSSDLEGPLEYRWDFGDGSTAEGAEASHAYVQGGPKQVRLSVTDTDGAAAEAVFGLRVNYLPIPREAHGQSSGVEDYRVSFNASGSSDAEGAVAAYIWDFDTTVDSDLDGRPDNDIDSSSPFPTFDYKSEGTYTARLTVVDADNGSASALITVKVKRTAPPDTSGLMMMFVIALAAVIGGAGAAAAWSRRKAGREERGRSGPPGEEVPPEALPVSSAEEGMDGLPGGRAEAPLPYALPLTHQPGQQVFQGAQQPYPPRGHRPR